MEPWGILIVSLVLSAVLLYFVVRAAMTAALRRHAVWQAQGGVQTALRDSGRRSYTPRDEPDA